MIEIGEKAEEILETLWIHTKENNVDPVSLDELRITDGEPLEQLLNAGCVLISDDQIRLTGVGTSKALNVVRRHRLAERLLTDVLDTKDTLIHEKACKFEHLLDRGLDESICILLGHPKICPHGRPIPPGRCCTEKQSQAQKVVAPLSQLAPGQKGRVAYVYATESNNLQKLIAMGILPGKSTILIQNFPSYVLQAGQTQFAVDREIADSIYIRIDGGFSSPAEDVSHRQRYGWNRLVKRFGLQRSREK